MEDYGSSLPSLCVGDSFQLFDSYDNLQYGRKKKKKPSLETAAEWRLDSPCHSPEVIMSGSVEDGTKRLVHSDSFADEYDTIDNGSTFGVDMEGFCEINASVTAGEDIMLSSSAKEGMAALKKAVAGHNLLKLTVEDVHDVSGNVSSASSSGLQSEFEHDVDVLLDGSLWANKDNGPAEADFLPDLSRLAVSGYLLSDIPSHPDLSCEAHETADSLISYCSDNDVCLKTDPTSDKKPNKKELLSRIKCEENICPQEQRSTVSSNFDALCTDTLMDDMQSFMNDCPRTSSCECHGRDCLCYKSETSSAEEEEICIEYIVSQPPPRVRRAKRSSRMVRRGPGRPRKIQNPEFVRRGPGRPRKKSVSDAVVWYQTRRKRTVSFSNGYKPRNRHKSLSEDKDAQNCSKRERQLDAAANKAVKPKRNREAETGRHCQQLNMLSILVSDPEKYSM